MDTVYRASCRTQFTKLCNSIRDYLKSSAEIATREEDISIHLQRLKNAHARLQQADVAVRPSIKDEDLPKEFEISMDYDDKAVSLIAQLEFLLREKHNNKFQEEVSKNDSKLNHSQYSVDDDFMGVRLKAIELKQFDGNFENWLPFWEQFKRVVHNNNKIPPATKFSYLSQSLIGNAATTITGFTPSEKCYDDAIALLQEEYGNSEKIIERYVQKLLGMKAVQSPSDLKGLRSLYNEVTSAIRTLSALHISPFQYALIIKSNILKCLPTKLRIEFHKADKKSVLSGAEAVDTNKAEGKKELDDILAYIKIEVEALEKAKLSEAECKKNEELSNTKRAAKGTAVGLFTSASNGQKQCLFCKGTQHNTHQCTSELTVEQRKAILQKEGRCYRCAGKNHTSKFCKSQWVKCGRCRGRHMTSLCEERNQSKGRSERSESHEKTNQLKKQNNEKQPVMTNGQTVTTTLSATNKSVNQIYLQTARAILCNQNNRKKLCTRIIMDNGSQRTYITENIASELNLPIVGEEMSKILTFGETQQRQTTNMKKVKVSVRSQYSNNCIEIIAVVVPAICADILPVPNAKGNNQQFTHLQLADRVVCDEHNIEGINMLFGQDNYWKFNSFESELIAENLVAVKTFFGWTIQGGSNESNIGYVFNTLHEEEESFDLSKFWNLESIGIDAENNKSKSAVDISFVNGRYEVSLPWKIPRELLNDNKSVAKNRLYNLTLKLIQDKSKMQQYHNGIQDMLNDGIAERVLQISSENNVYYMPHRPVYREDKLTTKVRIVFDASSSESDLLSLNEHLSSGENLVADLLATMLRFRSNKIALTSDIEKAFLQISLNKSDRDAHRFLWYDTMPNSLEDVSKTVEYRMKRVTFGVTSSPYLLQATINKHLQNLSERYGEICQLLQKSFYVDDLVLSVSSRMEAENIITTAREIMSAANFNLRKWNTNDEHVKLNFIKEETEQPIVQKVLGVIWCTASDRIRVDLNKVVSLTKNLRPTKRNLTKAMARVYDPLGILGPFTVRVKILLQNVWKANTAWDQTLSNDLANEFQKWLEELPLLIDLSIPRCISGTNAERNQLHLFADASPRAYGAVAYIRSISVSGHIETNFVCSKNRVSPIRENMESELTLPKLELTAALLASRLQHFILNSIDLKIESVTLWTDSTIALNWIVGDARQIKPYVTHRVKEINKLTNIYDWQHCDGKSNPADLLTRGITAINLMKSELWLHGPLWLSESQDEWPQMKTFTMTAATFNDKAVNSDREKEGEPILKIENFGQLKHLLRVTAFIFRFIKHIREELTSTTKRERSLKSVASVEELTAKEIRQVELYWIEKQQQKFFGEEINSIRRAKVVPKSSKILSLNPILINNILCVNIRLRAMNYANLDDTQKNPIILPKRSWLSYLIVQDAHTATLHGGVNMVLTFIRRTFWIVQGRQLIKSILHRCVVCKRLHGKCGSEPWVALPIERIRESPPFYTTGVDFAGPLYVKGHDPDHLKKTYIMLFTCATTRAIHLELVTNMSVKCCIEAIRRFIARRGVPSVIMSDNAKTFKRADKEIAKLFSLLQAPEVLQSTTHKYITWKYITERAAWWGGFWERLVRTVKTAIKAAIGKQLLSYEELETFLTEVESVTNNRPLTYISSDERDLEPLTPAHFLKGVNSVLPNTNFNFCTDQNSLSRSWQLRQNLMKRYLRRWHNEYLGQLRSIHHNKGGISRSIKPGSIVLVQEDLKSRLLWKMAMVETVYPGRDGRVRSCDIRTSNKTLLKRPIQLLVPLEITSHIAGAEDVENITESDT